MITNKGFGALAIILGVAILVLVGFVSYKAGQKDSSMQNEENSANSLSAVDRSSSSSNKVTGPAAQVAPTCLPSTPAYVNITSPIAGASFVTGQQVAIQWKSCNVQNVNIGLASGGKNFGQIMTGVAAATGSYQWTVTDPAQQFTGVSINSYQIVIDSQMPTILVKSGIFSVN